MKSVGPATDTQIKMSRLAYFLLLSSRQLDLMHRLMNFELIEIDQRAMTKGELFWFFGVLLLITKFEYGKRALL